MILGFKPQFRALILGGEKIHSIRSDRTNRWRAGMLIQMATGVRTKKYECFAEKECVSIQKITIDKVENNLNIVIDDRLLKWKDVEILARNDGFSTIQEFVDFFGDGVFTGKIIHWTNYKY